MSDPRNANVPILSSTTPNPTPNTNVSSPQRWHCSNGCDAAAITYDAKLPMHPCPKMNGLLVPLILIGTKAKQEAVERGDYVGGELVQTDANGRVIMSVVTTRDDGQDCTVYPPTATIERG
jgi:hypothetical protein